LLLRTETADSRVRVSVLLILISAGFLDRYSESILPDISGAAGKRGISTDEERELKSEHFSALYKYIPRERGRRDRASYEIFFRLAAPLYRRSCTLFRVY
jgi:hypothetical protein